MKELTLRPVRPNAGLEVEFAKRLKKAIDAMHASVIYWLQAEWRSSGLAEDAALPSDKLKKSMGKLTKRWQRNFGEGAGKLAEYFSTSIAKRSDTVLKNALKAGGFTVKFTQTPAMRDVLQASISQQVSLIKSIPQQYLHQVESAVMRSVQTGRNLESLVKDLQDIYAITRKRAELIAIDQNNKATSAMSHARQKEIGIKENVWLHSHAGKQPRPTHVKMDGKKYKIDKGMWDPAEQKYVFPGELIHCRCVGRPVIPGF